ncbi:uncharacterized protein BCR38DRAFT_527971 [Pseudomassariella vexata]|uniref:J domain-containing protein n=1 Tax=Pseudomassariella vexata TaxID=1141098 RepID=A0A1Y2DDX7_9PEZI|nr:uncharacterized protein BCR38DRAFT_527971 [Pseudomassariella vexata]ORY57481.1 hypothetical protein BCR38DRAFT_527971 [Pseudomassariella vexata]
MSGSLYPQLPDVSDISDDPKSPSSSVPPKSQSKRRWEEDAPSDKDGIPQLTDKPREETEKPNEPPSQTYNHGKGSKTVQKPLADCSPDFRFALEQTTESEVRQLRSTLREFTPTEVQEFIDKEKKTEHTRHTLFDRVYQQLSGIRRLKSGSEPTQEENNNITKEIESYVDAIMDSIGDAIVKAMDDDRNQRKQKALNYLHAHPFPTPTPDQLKAKAQGEWDEMRAKNLKESIAGWDPDLRSAVEKASGIETAKRRLDWEGIERSGIGTTSNSGSEPTDEEVREQVMSHSGSIASYFGDAITKVLEDDKKKSEGLHTPQQKRKAVNRVLKLMKQNASFYKLLGVKPSAIEAEIKKAQNNIVITLHPDQNKDEAAEECSKVINGAAQTLCDERKSNQYDTFLKNNPPPDDADTFDEEFDPGAFDDGDDDSDDAMDDDDDPDSEEDEEANYPRPSKQVQKAHAAIGDRIIKPFFREFDGPIKVAQLARALSRHDQTIQDDNQKNKRPDLDLFIVPPKKLLACQYRQRTIVEYYKGGLTKPERVQKDLQSLQDYFVKTRRRGLYQWPEAWTELLMKPLRKRLGDLGLPNEQAETKPTTEKPEQAKSSQPRSAQGNSTKGSTSEDTEMPDAAANDGPPPQETPVQQKELRDLAYSYPLRGRGGFFSFKLFVEVEGPNPLKVKRSDEVDDDQILGCRRSQSLHNIKKKEMMYRMLKETDFVRIKGVTWLPETGTDERTCWTWVWVEIRNVSDHERAHYEPVGPARLAYQENGR